MAPAAARCTYNTVVERKERKRGRKRGRSSPHEFSGMRPVRVCECRLPPRKFIHSFPPQVLTKERYGMPETSDVCPGQSAVFICRASAGEKVPRNLRSFCSCILSFFHFSLSLSLSLCLSLFLSLHSPLCRFFCRLILHPPLVGHVTHVLFHRLPFCCRPVRLLSASPHSGISFHVKSPRILGV